MYRQRGCSTKFHVAELVPEQQLAVLPQALVNVHARSILLEDRLRHEHQRSCRAGDAIEHFDHVLVGAHRLGRPSSEDRNEAHVDLGFAGGADLVVVHFEKKGMPEVPARLGPSR